MKIDSVKFQNYGAFFGSHTFRMSNRGLVLVLGENQDEPRMNSNGAGKSTVFDALDWALFGVVPRGDHVDSIVNEQAGKDCEVTVTILDDQGTAIEVRRWRKLGKTSGGVALTVGGVDKTALDPDETQRLIERELGLDRDTFHASVLFGQTDLFRFADATDGERMEALTKILQLGQLDQWAELAKAAQQKSAAAIARIESGLAIEAGRLQALEAQDFKAQIAQWDTSHASQLALAESQYQQRADHIAQLQKSLPDEAAMRMQLAAINATKPQPPAEMQAATAEIQRLSLEAATATADGLAADRQMKVLRDKIERMKATQGGTCGMCGQAISGEHVALEVGRMQSEISLLTQHAASAEQAAAYSNQRKSMIETALVALQAQLAERQREHATSVGSLTTAVLSAEREVAAHRMASKQLSEMSASIAAMRAQTNPFVQQEVLNREAVKIARAVEVDLRAKKAVAVTDAEYLAFWTEAFGPRGLKNYVLDTKLQAITDAANHWVKILTGGTIWVRIETQTMGRSTGTLRNKLNVRVFRYMPDGTVRERNYKSWSGGEKQRVSLGIDLGLASLVASRARKHYDVLILDELFRHLDTSGREAVLELLQHLAREKSSVFVVDHDAELGAQFEARVVVRKVGGVSTLVEESESDRRAGSAIPETQQSPTGENHDVPARKPRAKRATRKARGGTGVRD